ncbi:hypothetical protein GOODEAATRI_005865 [Goodea atripinnis]|uniref:Uncharacterized protein n=1 Tax=Goodea atripinnis TaxID=208336 RepID=A0ABV0PLB6_9TELE
MMSSVTSRKETFTIAMEKKVPKHCNTSCELLSRLHHSTICEHILIIRYFSEYIEYMHICNRCNICSRGEISGVFLRQLTTCKGLCTMDAAGDPAGNSGLCPLL